MMVLTVAVEVDTFAIDGRSFDRPVQPVEFFPVLGRPTRSGDFYTKPAPWGHRNNQLHVFDDLGIVLNEHHATRCIQEVRFVFNTEEAIHPTTCPFAGSLLLGGLSLYSDMPEEAITPPRLTLTNWLAGEWFSKQGSIYVALTCKGQRRPGQRRTKRRYLVDVSIAWRHERPAADGAPQANEQPHGRLQVCAGCGQDLRDDNRGDRCPECGTPIPAKNATMKSS